MDWLVLQLNQDSLDTVKFIKTFLFVDNQTGTFLWNRATSASFLFDEDATSNDRHRRAAQAAVLLKITKIRIAKGI